MKTLILTLSFTALAFGFDAVEEKETIRKTFAGAKEIEIDNVNGSIHAVGTGQRRPRYHSAITPASTRRTHIVVVAGRDS